jgi:hypothetical protein
MEERPVSMQAVRLSAARKRDLLRAVEGLSRSPRDQSDDVVVLVIGRGQALVGRPRSRGRAPDVRNVGRWVEAAVDGLTAEGSAPIATGLSAAEAAMLDEVGFGEGKEQKPSALERSRIEYELMLRESLSVEDAAERLGVTASRLRQRLCSDERSIFGIKDGRAWRIPAFQFQRPGRLVRNIDKVLPHVRPDAHPLAVKTWFLTPHPDLALEEDVEPLAPRAWLAAGRPVEAVAALAQEI